MDSYSSRRVLRPATLRMTPLMACAGWKQWGSKGFARGRARIEGVGRGRRPKAPSAPDMHAGLAPARQPCCPLLGGWGWGGGVGGHAPTCTKCRWRRLQAVLCRRCCVPAGLRAPLPPVRPPCRMRTAGSLPLTFNPTRHPAPSSTHGRICSVLLSLPFSPSLPHLCSSLAAPPDDALAEALHQANLHSSLEHTLLRIQGGRGAPQGRPAGVVGSQSGTALQAGGKSGTSILAHRRLPVHRSAGQQVRVRSNSCDCGSGRGSSTAGTDGVSKEEHRERMPDESSTPRRRLDLRQQACARPDQCQSPAAMAGNVREASVLRSGGGSAAKAAGGSAGCTACSSSKGRSSTGGSGGGGRRGGSSAVMGSGSNGAGSSAVIGSGSNGGGSRAGIGQLRRQRRRRQQHQAPAASLR